MVLMVTQTTEADPVETVTGHLFRGVPKRRSKGESDVYLDWYFASRSRQSALSFGRGRRRVAGRAAGQRRTP
jgi:hypothetical protein